ncbi:hypothetical protein DFP72DRAFT_1062500 [Ephemerocybe angulata]|uniref:Uncharacterized protein n=1 Tax=Ephemerocybe angulata TaxID=980116 RepID=A0A8H6HHG4_9AGAR|nr:hypothetical protein DFP72DRAFT_1075717 [Tulosesus angulatus]KAF6760754.1 hypothetical protein DFP72DRAFT_1062500 [Tulosesus angulatus]
MQFKLFVVSLACIIASTAPAVRAAEGDVFRATRVYHTVIKQSPFLVTSTTTVTWTQGPSVTDAAATTTVPVSVATAPPEA